MTAHTGNGRPTPSPTFGDRLTQAVAERESQIVLGIDPDPAKLWPAAIDRTSEARARLALTLLGRGGGGRRITPPSAGVVARLETAAAVLAHCRALIDAAAPGVRRRQTAARLLRAPRRARAGSRWSTSATYARERGLLVIADAKRGDVPVTAAAYGAGARRAARRRRSAPSTASAPTPSPPTRCSAATRSSRWSTPRASTQAGAFVLVRTSNPGAADILDAAWTPASACGSDWPRSSTSSARPGPPPQGHRRRHRRDRARAPRASPRADADDPVPAPGHRRPGRRRRGIAPAFAPGKAGGLVTASRSIANAHEAPGAAPVRRRARRSRAAARAGMGPGLTILDADGRPQPRALSGAHRADRLRLRALFRRQGRQRTRRAGTRATTTSATATPTATAETKKSVQEEAQDVHGQGRRHAVRDRGEERPHARELHELNPDLDPQTIAPGQKIRLSE